MLLFGIIAFFAFLIGVVILFLWLSDETRTWQKRIDSGNPVRYEEVVTLGSVDETYFDRLDEESGLRHVAWKYESESSDGTVGVYFIVAEFDRDSLMTKFVRVGSDDEVTKIIHEWNAD